jgi:hypothetical protein
LDRPLLLPPARPLDRPVFQVSPRQPDLRRLRVVAMTVRTDLSPSPRAPHALFSWLDRSRPFRVRKRLSLLVSPRRGKLMTRVKSCGLRLTLWKTVWQYVIKKSLCRSIRRSPIQLTVMPPASLRSTFMYTTLSLTTLLTTPHHQPSAEPLRWASSASTRKGSLVGVEVEVDRLTPQHLPRHLLYLSGQLIKFAQIDQRLVPHLVRQMGQRQTRLLFRALDHPPVLQMGQRLRLTPRHPPTHLYLSGQRIKLSLIHQSVHRRLVPHRSLQMVPLFLQAQCQLPFRARAHPPVLRMGHRLR